ncbi:MAG: YdcF family protein [Alphaproteobacteria bacterium]
MAKLKFKPYLISPIAKWRRRLTIIALLMLICWGGGLFLFMSKIPQDATLNQNFFNDSPPPNGEFPYPAIIVLTGGSLRIDSGINALKNGYGTRLFITGVYQGVDVQRLLSLSQYRQTSDLVQSIELGHLAEDTVGNAIEIAHWVQANNIERAIIITGAYHMPRSLLELKHYVPDLTIKIAPVFPEHVKLDSWYLYRGTLGLLIGEYHKYGFAYLRSLFFFNKMHQK